jgi:alanyl-tRNA synthetase
MTHVLNAALRSILGDSVDQRGSLCNDEKLRFDFSHKSAMTPQQVQQAEDYCQQVVQKAVAVTSKVMPLAQAKEIKGVRAVFGEVYPDPVRVVSIGDDTSVEFCGGTHLTNTAEAGAFVILEETAVAKGIRRISAVTGETATLAIREGAKYLSRIQETESLAAGTPGLDKVAGALRKELDEAVVSAALKAEGRGRIERIQKKAVEAKKAALAQRVDIVLNTVKKEVEDALADKRKILVLNVEIGADSKASQKVLNAVKKVAGDRELAFLGISEEDPGSGGRLFAFASVPDFMVEAGLKADEWILAALESCGGRGGGKSGNAQGQAQECSDLNAVIVAGTSFAETKATEVA